MRKKGSQVDQFLSDSKELVRFQNALCDWFDGEGKDYPWRQTTDPYAILVSELMLQQTQVATVLGRGYFDRWMTRFPNWEVLAGAEEEAILKAWEGLGYYNRARNLQKAAQAVLQEHGGDCPSDAQELQSLPGVGRYTAGAVVSFAFGERAPIVDGNVSRVLARLFAFEDPVDSTKAIRQVWQWADQMTPAERVRSYNSAIMELGQRICKKGSPDCSACPVSQWCVARAKGMAETLPRKKTRTKVTQKDERVGFVYHQGRVFLTRESGGRRKGLWKLPGIVAGKGEDFESLFRLGYAITRYQISMDVLKVARHQMEDLEGLSEGDWFDPGVEGDLPPMGAPYLKAIRKYQNIHDDLLSGGPKPAK